MNLHPADSTPGAQLLDCKHRLAVPDWHHTITLDVADDVSCRLCFWSLLEQLLDQSFEQLLETSA